MTSKWPKIAWKHNSCIKSPFLHAMCLFIGFWRRWVNCAYQIWVWSNQITSKQPWTDLKWPLVTWKHNYFTKSPLGHVICLFIGFLDTDSIVLVRFKFEATKWPPNDLLMTSSDLQWRENITLSLFLSWIDCLIRFEFGSTNWPPNDLQATLSDL